LSRSVSSREVAYGALAVVLIVITSIAAHINPNQGDSTRSFDSQFNPKGSLSGNRKETALRDPCNK
jgi:hypothetical protein